MTFEPARFLHATTYGGGPGHLQSAKTEQLSAMADKTGRSRGGCLRIAQIARVEFSILYSCLRRWVVMGYDKLYRNPMVLKGIPMNANYKTEPAATGYLRASRYPPPLAMNGNGSMGWDANAAIDSLTSVVDFLRKTLAAK
jgi:hypothetical protein